MSKRISILLSLLAIAVALASGWAKHNRPELAPYIGAVAFGAYVVFALTVMGRLVRASERPPGVMRRTGVLLALSGAMIASLLLLQWPYSIVVLLLCYIVLAVEVRLT